MFSCFRGYQLHNPFHTIWATKIGNNLAVSFYIRVYSSSVLAVLQDRLFEILRDQPPKVAKRQRRCFFLTFSVRLHYYSGSLCISLLLVSLCHGVQSVLEHPG